MQNVTPKTPHPDLSRVPWAQGLCSGLVFGSAPNEGMKTKPPSRLHTGTKALCFCDGHLCFHFSLLHPAGRSPWGVGFTSPSHCHS